MRIRRMCCAGVAALVACAALAASAEAKTLIYTQFPEEGFEVKPGKLIYTSVPYIVGATISVRKLDWKDWGERKATSKAKVKLCGNMAPCERFRAPVKAKGLVRNAEGSGDDIYSKLVVKRKAEDFKLCVYAEVCPG